jgi:NADH:ubiquinone oxidoreductase subunit H
MGGLRASSQAVSYEVAIMLVLAAFLVIQKVFKWSGLFSSFLWLFLPV